MAAAPARSITLRLKDAALLARQRERGRPSTCSQSASVASTGSAKAIRMNEAALGAGLTLRADDLIE
jgi:hypothetical protein